MSEPDDSAENFLRRWSRRKHAAETRPEAGSEPPKFASAEGGPSPGTAPHGEPDRPGFDPATLPSIESITATSDIRAFLAPGVPEELSRAALRRAWMTDPTIRDFVGIAENQWDFTRPDGVPGFGPLELTPELRRMVAQLVGEAPAQATSRPDPDADPIDQVAHKLPELSSARTDQANDATNAALKCAPLPEGEPQTTGEAPTNSLAVDAATQQTGSEAATAPGSGRRRHGGAIPK
jgi:hypothetical protein